MQSRLCVEKTILKDQDKPRDKGGSLEAFLKMSNIVSYHEVDEDPAPGSRDGPFNDDYDCDSPQVLNDDGGIEDLSHARLVRKTVALVAITGMLYT